MERNSRKEKLVKQLLNRDFDVTDEDELIEMLLDNPTAIDSDKEEDERRTMGDKLADKVTEIAGSWGFIVGFCIFLIVWMIINTIMIVKFDEYPFILLNLILSCIAALQAPIIMMSQNRAAKKDSLRSLNDYKTDLKSELILEVLHEQMKDLQANQKKILKLLEENDVK
jgi:predicted membrane protein